MNIDIFKPKKENLISNVSAGSFLIFIALLDLLTNSFLDFNFTSFLPSKLSYLTPLIFGILGL